VVLSFPNEFLTTVNRLVREEHRRRSEPVREALRIYARPGVNPP
jgi:metal-responsive CopG/Arc/MetJ family transcriptional regulator